MATHTTDIPLASTSAKSRLASENLEAEAIGLEVPVRIQGTQSTSVMGTTEHAEPFQEDTSTMIVFPRGAVVKLLARVRSGQSLELTNLRTNAKLPCKVFQVTSANNSVFYVKLEFLQPSQGFWGIHFPSDPSPVQRKQQSAPPAEPAYSASASFVDSVSISPAPPAAAPSRDIFSHAAVPERPSAPLLNDKPEAPSPSAPSAYVSPFAAPIVPPKEPEIKETSAPSTVPPLAPSPEAPKLDAPQPASSSSQAPAYGPARNWQKEPIEPLAGPSATSSSVESAVAALVETPAPAAEKVPIPGRRPVPAPSKSERRREKPVRPVFGELHSFSSATSASSSPRLSDAALKMSSVARPLPVPARSGPRFFKALVTLCVLTVLAAGVMYARRHSLIFSNSGSANAPDASALSAPVASQPTAATPSQASATIAPALSSPVVSSEASPAAAPPVTPAPVAHPSFASKSAALAPRKPASGKAAPAKVTSAPAEARSKAADAAPSSSPSAGAEIPAIYAGDLNARPEIKPRAAKRMDAHAPEIAASAPAGISGVGSTALSSIVPGVDSGLTAPVAPAAPETAVRTGGSVQQPKLLSSVAPVYPPLARQSGVEGEVTIQATIGLSGNVTSMKVISGPALLRDAAMNALRKWRYTPAKLDNKPISSQYVVTIRFRLNN